MFSGPLRVMFCLERAEKMKAVFSLGVRISFSEQQRFCESNRIQMWELAAGAPHVGRELCRQKQPQRP